MTPIKSINPNWHDVLDGNPNGNVNSAAMSHLWQFHCGYEELYLYVRM